jgi:hypothetical protein
MKKSETPPTYLTKLIAVRLPSAAFVRRCLPDSFNLTNSGSRLCAFAEISVSVGSAQKTNLTPTNPSLIQSLRL